MYDNTAASGTKIATVSLVGGQFSLSLNVQFSTGLTADITSLVGTPDVTLVVL